MVAEAISSLKEAPTNVNRTRNGVTVLLYKFSLTETWLIWYK